MAAHQQIDRQVRALVHVAEDLLTSHGFRIVTDDPEIFPYVRPGLAALQDGRLLVFAVAVFPRTGQFFEPSELIHLREELESIVRENRPERNPRVQHVETVALVQTPDDVRAAAPVGDIKWVVVRSPEELPEEFDRLVFGLGTSTETKA